MEMDCVEENRVNSYVMINELYKSLDDQSYRVKIAEDEIFQLIKKLL